MAVVRFSVIVLLLVQQVFLVCGCLDFDNLKNCNDCIRCGGYWCNDPNEKNSCTAQRFDDWCPGQQEKIKFLTHDQDEDGTSFKPKYRERTLTIGTDGQYDISYPSKSNEPKVEIVVNSTQTSNFQVSNETSCYNSMCTTTIRANPEKTFCAANGGVSEYFNIKLSVQDIKEEAVMKIHVPCACACSEKVEEMSPICNGRGSLSCGVCTCKDGWKGTFCETPICEEKRGDVPCTDSSRDNIECSGNGVCGPCDKCECFTNREGSRYFDKDNYCADICMTINDCDDCFLSPKPGRCQTCHFALYRQNYNQTLMTQKDDSNRHLWVRCNGTIDECNYEYAAMRDENDDTFFMVTNSCDPVQEKRAGAVSLTLPIVLFVIALVAAAVAVVGYMMWKNRPAPVPLADPMYQNISAEDCTGENPLYKPPTSSFKNPTYGKW